MENLVSNGTWHAFGLMLKKKDEYIGNSLMILCCIRERANAAFVNRAKLSGLTSLIFSEPRLQRREIGPRKASSSAECAE